MAMNLLHHMRDPVLRRTHGDGVFLRALTDVAEGRVLDVEVGTDRADVLRFEAHVRRGDGESLAVRAVLIKHGRTVIATGLCECDDTGTCRHVLAVLLAMRADAQRVLA